jgi:hypothetical protein
LKDKTATFAELWQRAGRPLISGQHGGGGAKVAGEEDFRGLSVEKEKGATVFVGCTL